MLVSGGLVSAGLADAGVRSRPGASTGEGVALTGPEREVITIESSRVVADQAFGLVVTVTFRGNIERYLGQHGLRHGLLAMILFPRSRPGMPVGIVDESGGFVPTPSPILERSGKHLTIKRGSVDAFNPEQVLRVGVGGQATVIRSGNRVVFAIPGGVLTRLTRIEVELFAGSPVGAGRLSVDLWRKLLRAHPTGLVSRSIPTSNPSCDQLSALRTRLSDVLVGGLEPERRLQEQAEVNLTEAVSDYASLGHEVDRILGPRGGSTGQLTSELSRVSARIHYLRSQIAGLKRLLERLGVPIKDCAAAATTSTPTPPSSPTTTPTLPTPAPSVQVVQTDPGLSEYMAAQPGLDLSTVQPEGVPLIDVNEQIRYQRFDGIGAAMTDSSAWLIYDQLAASDQLALMQHLFGSSGIRLNFLRVPMAASDFTVSADPYSYDDMPTGESDPSLSQFSIDHDLPYIIPALRAALAVNPGLEILASPSSPPGWMKANDSLDNINDQGTLLPSAYGPLANYFVKFIQAYESSGVPIDAITVQNEPRTTGSGTSYPGLTLPAADEATFISQYLAPALDQAGLHPKIYGNDLSWDQLAYADSLVSSAAAGDLAGIAWHCYFGSPAVMSQLQQSAPGLDQIADECSPEIRNFGAPEYLISTLRNWASVVAVWNAALDPEGGPHGTAYGCPGCTGVVTINEQSHTFSFSSEYYQLGQVSAFVHPGAVRIDSPNFVTYGVDSSNIETVSSGLDDVAFLNPDGSKVLIVNNNSTGPISFGVETDGNYFAHTVAAQAMTTFTWQ
jgi:glucosylceramidase